MGSPSTSPATEITATLENVPIVGGNVRVHRRSADGAGEGVEDPHHPARRQGPGGVPGCAVRDERHERCGGGVVHDHRSPRRENLMEGYLSFAFFLDTDGSLQGTINSQGDRVGRSEHATRHHRAQPVVHRDLPPRRVRDLQALRRRQPRRGGLRRDRPGDRCGRAVRPGHRPLARPRRPVHVQGGDQRGEGVDRRPRPTPLLRRVLHRPRRSRRCGRRVPGQGRGERRRT